MHFKFLDIIRFNEEKSYIDSMDLEQLYIKRQIEENIGAILTSLGFIILNVCNSKWIILR